MAAPALAQTMPGPAPTPAASGVVTGHRGPGMWRLIEGLDGVTSAQQQQIETLRGQYRQSHQPGSPPDRAAMRTLRQQVMAILTPAQRAQLRSELQQIRRQRQQQGGDLASPPPG